MHRHDTFETYGLVAILVLLGIALFVALLPLRHAPQQSFQHVQITKSDKRWETFDRRWDYEIRELNRTMRYIERQQFSPIPPLPVWDEEAFGRRFA